MEETKMCEETVGLFVLRTCQTPWVTACDTCSKSICKTHSFEAALSGTDSANTLCLTCFTAQDTRLTTDIELYSKDRYVWRRKMIDRFHEEYNYMVFMAEDYGSLFLVSTYGDYDDIDDNTAYFDS